MLVTPALESLGQEDHHKLGVRLDYVDKILSEEKKIRGGWGLGDGLASKLAAATQARRPEFRPLTPI